MPLETLEARLGSSLCALVRARGVPLAKLTEVTALPSPVRRRGAFALDFADGTRLKGRRLRSAERADTVQRLRGALGEGFARILDRSGDALLLEWVEGPTLASLETLPTGAARRCGRMLGALHATHSQGSSGGAPPSADELLQRLERNAGQLCEAQRLDDALARRALDAAAAQRPKEMSLGIVHKDFCAENIVLGPGGGPVCIDNANLAFGPHDLDLARTWYRWPMALRDRRRFGAGYRERRSLSAFLDHFAFWAIVALVGSAGTRLRAGAPGLHEPVERLKALLEHLEGASRFGRSTHPFWVV